MNCPNCQSYLNEEFEYCPKCGKKIEKSIMYQTVDTNYNKKKTTSIVLGILSLFGTFFLIFSPIGLVLGVIGLVLAIKTNQNGSNVAGIIINAIGSFIAFILTGIIILFLLFATRIIDTLPEGPITEYSNRVIERY